MGIGRLRRFGIALAALASAGFALTIVLPLIPSWPLFLLEHFRLQFVVIGIVVSAACASLHVRGWFDVAVFATILNAYAIVPDLMRTRQPIPRDGAPLRVLYANVHTSNRQFSILRELIDREKPDVIGLVEVDSGWLAGLAPALTGYSYRVEDPQDDNFGVALYSKLPMTAQSEDLSSVLPTVVATVELDGAQLGVVLTHPIPPVTSANARWQERQLRAVAARSRTFDVPRIIVGDFNATPWSRPFVHLADEAGLCDTRAGFGLQASFPTWSSIAMIPIDHVLASCSIGVRNRRIGRDIGSDHLPVVIDLVVPR